VVLSDGATSLTARFAGSLQDATIRLLQVQVEPLRDRRCDIDERCAVPRAGANPWCQPEQRGRHVCALRIVALIREVTSRFADAVNRHDWQAMATLFVEDAVWEAAAGELSFRQEGRKAIQARLESNIEHVEVVFYLAGPPLIELTAPKGSRIGWR
jgi:hypothetical protein